jgi:high-affinity K+ transport system ATPase subunit B
VWQKVGSIININDDNTTQHNTNVNVIINDSIDHVIIIIFFFIITIITIINMVISTFIDITYIIIIIIIIIPTTIGKTPLESCS